MKVIVGQKIESPLCVRSDGHRLIITVGINRLQGNEYHPTIPELQINSPTMWANDIKTELEREDEQGASLLTDLFDRAIQNALDNGSFAINEKAYDRAMKRRMPNNAVRGAAEPRTLDGLVGGS